MKKIILIICMIILSAGLISAGLWGTNARYFNANRVSSTSGSYSGLFGFKIYMNQTANLTSIEQDPTANQVTAVVCTTPNCIGSQLGIATISSNYGNFTSPITLQKGNYYYVLVNGSSQTREEIFTFTNNTLFNYTAGVNDGSDSVGTGFDILALWFTPLLVNITLINPSNNTFIIPQNLTFNSSIISINSLVNASLFINNTKNETIDLSGVSNNSVFYKYLDQGSYNWNIQACDISNNCLNSSSRNLIISNYELNSINYNNVTIGGTEESFNLNITSITPLTSAYLVYNGTNYNPSISRSGNYSVLSNNITIPIPPSAVNYTFYYNLNFNDGSPKNTSSYSQLVNTIMVDNCGNYTRRIFNMTLFDENTRIGILNSSNPKLEYTLTFYDVSRTTSLLNYSNVSYNNFTSLCFGANNFNSSVYSLDLAIRYKADDYVAEYYNVLDYEFSNSSVTQVIKLYDLLISNSTEFLATAYGNDYFPAENVLIYLQRQYLGTNEFITVELPKTDTNGQAILHLIRNDLIYNIIGIKDGEIIFIYNNIIAYCDDYTIGNCKLILNTQDTESEIYNYNSELGISFTNPSYDSSTNDVSFSFNSLDNENKNITMQVYKIDYLNSSLVCSDSVNFDSGSLNCDIGLITEGKLKVMIYLDNELLFSNYINLDSTGFGMMGYFALFIFAIAFVLLFGTSKVGVLIGVVLGFVSGISLGMLQGELIGVGASGIWLLVIVVIAFIKLRLDPGDTG